MASATDYANWIVNNEDKKGTPEFNTVAAAYQDALKISNEQKLVGPIVVNPKTGSLYLLL